MPALSRMRDCSVAYWPNLQGPSALGMKSALFLPESADATQERNFPIVTAAGRHSLPLQKPLPVLHWDEVSSPMGSASKPLRRRMADQSWGM